LDIGGNEKYTTKIISGLCSLYPDYALIVVSATKGVTPIAEQHIKLAVVFEVPIIIVITHVDLVTETEAYSIRDDVHFY
jgi:GTPase